MSRHWMIGTTLAENQQDNAKGLKSLKTTKQLWVTGNHSRLHVDSGDVQEAEEQQF